MKAFIEFFDQHISGLHKTYNWPVRPRTQQGLVGFHWHETSGTMAECIAMKHHLTSIWATATDQEKAQLARWIVSDWGGVRTNDPSTLAFYVNCFDSDDFPTPLYEVASYSKILSVKNCTEYAIYDARVAACLNAVQLLMKAENPIFFHYIPSRNKVIQGNKTSLGFVDAFPKKELVGKRGWQKVEKDDSYMTYLELLRGLKSHYTTYEIYHFEMTLFSKAPEICMQVMRE